MKKSTLALAVYAGVLATQAGAAGFLDDSKATLSSRTLYFEQDPRENPSARAKAQDQRQTAQGFLFNFISGYTPGTVGFGLDVQGMYGINLSGGIDNRLPTTANTVSPTSSDGSPVADWARAGANAKVKLSKTELKSVTLCSQTCRSWYPTTVVCCRKPLKVASSLPRKSTT